MLTKSEKKAALYAISFNRGKALRLFLFCLACFSVGISIWYWQQDHSYGNKIESYRQQMLSTIDEQLKDQNFTAFSELQEGVLSCRGIVDFDHVVYLNDKPNLYEKSQQLKQVKGQKRQLATGVYEIRFVPSK